LSHVVSSIPTGRGFTIGTGALSIAALAYAARRKKCS
jgi:hypothetical protein